jgi:hypothetical protein
MLFKIIKNNGVAGTINSINNSTKIEKRLLPEPPLNPEIDGYNWAAK